MRKFIIAVVVIGLLACGYYYVSKHARISLSQLQGKTVKAHRGDLTIPISASGNIRPASITQIKSKASGEVIAIPFEIGAVVKKNDIVVQLLDIDERNSRDRAKADRDRARIELEKARIAKRQAELVGIPAAEAKRAQAAARFDMAKWDFDKQKQLRELKTADGTFDAASNLEYVIKEASYNEALAATKAAEVDVAQARIAVEQAQKNIETAEEMLNTAQKALDDAEERLRETIVRSPIDGMVLSKNVQIGEVVQSGKTMFTGGTVLMEIADVSDIYAVVNVDEADIGQVSDLAPETARPGSATRPSNQPASLPAHVLPAGAPVEVTVESFKDKKFYGVIERISPQSEVVQMIAKFKVWIRITSDNRNDLRGLLNTQAEAHFTAKSVVDAVLVSYDAMMKDPASDAFGVFLKVQEPGKNRPEPKFRPCEFGVDNGIEVQVLSGLQEGDEVYIKLPQKTDKEKKEEEDV